MLSLLASAEKGGSKESAGDVVSLLLLLLLEVLNMPFDVIIGDAFWVICRRVCELIVPMPWTRGRLVNVRWFILFFMVHHANCTRSGIRIQHSAVGSGQAVG